MCEERWERSSRWLDETETRLERSRTLGEVSIVPRGMMFAAVMARF